MDLLTCTILALVLFFLDRIVIALVLLPVRLTVRYWHFRLWQIQLHRHFAVWCWRRRRAR